jgi:hypothetical protein
MLPQFLRQGGAIRSLHPSTYALGSLVVLSLIYFLSTPYRSIVPESRPPQLVFSGSSPLANSPYPQVVVTGDSIAERSFEDAQGYGSKLASMVC